MTAPFDVARDLRWRMVRGPLLDPIAMIGTVAAAWAAWRLGGLHTAPDTLGTQPGAPEVLGPLLAPVVAVGGLLAVAAVLADDLLFRRPENVLLRAQPLPRADLARLRELEVGWWTNPLRLVGAGFVYAAAGALPAATLLLPGVPAAAVGLALLARRLGPRSPLFLALLAAPAAAAWFAFGDAPSPLPAWAPVAVGVAAHGALLALGAALRPRFVADYDALASTAATAPPRRRSGGWRRLERLLPLPAPLLARLLRDLAQLLRGRDLRAAGLFALAPLSVVTLATTTVQPNEIRWAALTAAALGGAAVAYAVGPGVHLLRNRAMSWERLAPRPGRRALAAALLWAAIPALAHGALVLGACALSSDGLHRAALPSMIVPVLGLELAMAHYVVAWTQATTLGRRVAGEGTLVFSLPVVALIVALAGRIAPPTVLLYFVVSAPMLAQAARRYDAVEVTW
jgi:hypothetical protein